jgi:ubiquinone/menaquinone biosynthesis C-methylase UbiE
MNKDLFSSQAVVYSKYRPSYPPEVVEYILAHCTQRSVAWDCATGNGQFAVLLAPHFEKVHATDISEQQLANAARRVNIRYEKQAAERTHFADHYFDLVTIAQAYHWFNFDLFEKEVKRVSKPGAVIAIIGYNLLKLADEKFNAMFHHFYNHVVGPYWNDERRFLEENYTTIPFPFTDTEHRYFSTVLSWTREDLAGYLKSWSSVQHFIRAEGFDPVDGFISSLDNYWQAGELKQVEFPLFVKLGRTGS